MKVSKIKIKNIFGIEEISLDGKDYEIIGTNRAGKTNIIEAIRYALRNKSNKGVILRAGTEEGEVLFETDTGISILRRERIGKISLDTVKDGKTPIAKKEGFLRELFSELQLDPVKFTALPEQEQNRIILDLIDFKWDTNWIKEQFGEIVPEIDYGQNILKVLADIQAEDGYYFRTRQAINRESREKQAIIGDIAKVLPDNYTADSWRNKSIFELHTKIEQIRENNRKIEKAQAIVNSQENEMRGFDSKRQIDLSALDQEFSVERNRIEKEIIKLEEQLKTLKKDLSGLEEKKIERKEKINLEYQANVSKFEALIGENKEIAQGKIQATGDLVSEAEHIEKMKGLIGEYDRMVTYQTEVEGLTQKAQNLTEKIEKARSLPAEILAKTNLPLDNLSISPEGKPLLNNLPLSNASEGELLELCVDVANLKENALKLILIDGVEKLSSRNKDKLYAKCKEKGVQFIATRTTEDDTLTVVEL